MSNLKGATQILNCNDAKNILYAIWTVSNY